MTTKHKIKTFENIISDDKILIDSYSKEYIIDLFEKNLRNDNHVSNIEKFDDRFEYDFTF